MNLNELNFYNYCYEDEITGKIEIIMRVFENLESAYIYAEFINDNIKDTFSYKIGFSSCYIHQKDKHNDIEMFLFARVYNELKKIKFLNGELEYEELFLVKNHEDGLRDYTINIKIN